MSVKNAVAMIARRLGFEIRRYGISPFQKNDREFVATYNVVRANTLVDIHRCYELWSLVEQSAKLNGSLIEVGVWRGGTGALMAKKAKLCGIADPIYLCDTFTGIVKASTLDPLYSDGEHADTSRWMVETLLIALGLSNVVILEGIFPDESSEYVWDKQFRFCHIDVDVYQSAKDVVDFVWTRLVVGGIIVFDDYRDGRCEGIRTCVDELRGLSDRLVIINQNGHAIVIKIK